MADLSEGDAPPAPRDAANVTGDLPRRGWRGTDMAGEAAGSLGPAGRLAVVVLVALVLAIVVAGGPGDLAAAPYALVGAFLAVRRPANSVGWVLLATSLAFAVAFFALPVTTAQLEAGTVAPAVMAASLAQAANDGVLLTLLLAIAIVFPGGRLPDGRWGRIARLALGFSAVVAVVGVFAPTVSIRRTDSAVGYTLDNPLAIAPSSPLWLAISAGTAVVYVLAAAAVVSLVVRLRRAGHVERAQLRWLVWSMAFMFAGLLLGIAGDAVFPDGLGGLVWIPAEIGFVLPPVAIGIAVLRYRLYEIDRIVSRTISWASVSAILVAVFVAAILVTQAVLAPFTTSNTLAVAASTLVVASLAQPLRRRIQARVDRRFNRARFDADRIVTAFAGRLRDEVDLAQLEIEVTATVASTVQPAAAAIWLRT
jgi:hypothetical protein